MKGVWQFLNRFFEFFVIAILILWIFYFRLVDYGFSQLLGQISIIRNTEPIENLLINPAFPDSSKERLRLVGRIKRFAIDSLGLTPTENYSTFYDQKGKPLLMNLTAAEKFKLEAYTWNFPVLGSVSYKGFFNFDKGKAEKEELSEKGYDVDYGPVSAWSTLGFFRDPVFSGMLKRNDGQLAELIIHEMTHGTIYLKSSVDFNENLASAVGEYGAERFLEATYGDSSAELVTYVHEEEDYNLYANHFLLGTKALDSLYNAFVNESEAVKTELKKELIQKIVSTLDTVPFHSAKYKNRFTGSELPNNAYFLSFVRYDSQKEEMKKELQGKFGGNVKSYLDSLKQND